MHTEKENIHSFLIELQTKNAILKRENDSQQEKIKHYESENAKLQQMLIDFKRHRFGNKSERWESGEQQRFVFNEAEIEAKKPELEQDSSASLAETITIKAHTKSRGHRKPLPTDIPRRVIEITLPADEQFDKDGTPLKAIGKEISEKLVYEPAKLEVLEYHRTVYGAACGDYVKTAPPLPCIIPKGIVTSELLAHIITSKYADGLPLYRQEDIFERLNVNLLRSTMGRWIVQAAEACMPIRNVLSDRLLASSYVSCDETPVQVLKEKNRKPESRSWMWVMGVPYGENRIVLFDYDASRSGAVVERLFADYEGTVQTDGYAGYNVLSANKKITQIGCNMHGRRYFEQAFKMGAQSGSSLAEVALRYYQRLYAIEEHIRKKPPEERGQWRQQQARPIWMEFKRWAEENSQKVPPKSKLGVAFHYFLSQNDRLQGYLNDGKLEMDNGFIERAIRKFAIGRNNWLFADTTAGADASALFYSLLITAKINGVNPYEALKQIFNELPTAKSIADFERIADIILPLPSPH